MSRPLPTLPTPAPHGGAGQPRLAVDYAMADSPAALLQADDVLAVFGFGDAAPRHDDPRYLRVPLQPHGPAPYEVWRGHAPVRHGRSGDIAWATDGDLLFGAIEVDEADVTAAGIAGTDVHAADVGEAGVGGQHAAAAPSGVADAAAHAYARMSAFVQASHAPHLLRVWNYLDAITLGEGDAERYRQFCVGRARGLGAFDAGTLPAATAIGRCDDARTIQVYWLAGRGAGTPVENPRQVSAYRYPRLYGPQPPSFARAMLPPRGGSMPLLLSGTASVVGHASRHHGELLKQLDETFTNFDALLASARATQPALPPTFGAGTRLKVYVRDHDDLETVATALDARFGDDVPRIILHAAICRRELAVEIDGVHGAPG